MSLLTIFVDSFYTYFTDWIYSIYLFGTLRVKVYFHKLRTIGKIELMDVIKPIELMELMRFEFWENLIWELRVINQSDLSNKLLMKWFPRHVDGCRDVSMIAEMAHVKFRRNLELEALCLCNGPVTPMIYSTIVIAWLIVRTISCIIITIVGLIASVNAPT